MIIEATLSTGEVRRVDLDYTLELSYMRSAGWCLWWRDPAAKTGEPPELIGCEFDDGFSVAINGVVVSGSG